MFKNVRNDLDDLVQLYVLLLLWYILNQSLIGYGFIKSCHFDKANQNFITTIFLIWSSKTNQSATKCKHTEMEYIILSQLGGLSIMGHGTKYKWIICEKELLKNYIWYDHSVWVPRTDFELP